MQDIKTYLLERIRSEDIGVKPRRNLQLMRMIDTEGEILTREVKVRFVDGEPIFLEAVYIWKNTLDFDRFMRFAKTYAKSNGLGYSEKK